MIRRTIDPTFYRPSSGNARRNAGSMETRKPRKAGKSGTAKGSEALGKQLPVRTQAKGKQKDLMRKWKFSAGATDSPSETNSPESTTYTNNINTIERPSETESEALQVIPRPLGEPFTDIGGVFGKIRSPYLPNAASLLHWMSFNDQSNRPGRGWLRGLEHFWLSLLFDQGPCETPLLSLAAYMALRKQKEILSVNLDKYIIRAKLITIEGIKSYQKVTGTLLVIIGNLALDAMALGDLEAAQTHWNALVTFKDYKCENPSHWAFVNGIDTRFAANLMVPPALPYHLPKAFKKPIPLSATEISREFRRGSNNAYSYVKILGDDFLKVRHIFTHLHIMLLVAKPGPGLDMNAIFGQIYDLVFNTTTLVGSIRKEAPSPIVQYREILAIALSLVFWKSVESFIPGQGIIEYNMLGRVSHLMKLVRGAFVERWLSLTDDIQGLLWIVLSISLQASCWRYESFPFWTGILRQVLERPEMSTIDIENHFLEWPYTSSWRTLLDGDPWTVINDSGRLPNMELKDDEKEHTIHL